MGSRQQPWSGPPHLENGPYNLLALDGGGIRGVSGLVVLHRIMTRIQEKEGLDELPKPCDYFHLVGGTSTGGLIAIMLGRLRMNTSQALAEYDSFAKKIFRKLNRQISLSSQFRESTLKNVVCEVVENYDDKTEKSYGLMRDPDPRGRGQWLGRAFVCANPSRDQNRGPRRMRSYSLPSSSDSAFVSCGEDWGKDIKIWEAARATTAAPLYFRPISITGSDGLTEEFIDAALGCNNPISEVLDEAGEILDSSCKLGCVLSLGTGTRPKKLEKASGMVRNLHVIKLLKDFTTDSERMHGEMLKRFTDFPETYFRFSVPDAALKVGMAQYKKIGELKRMTERYLDEDPAARAGLEKVVDILRLGKTEGVTVGHVRYPNKDQIILDTRRAQAGGIASRLFTGRTAILEKMSAYFSKRRGNDGPRREFLLYGMGGVGKSQIALKFKQMVEGERRFDRVFWVDATDSATLEECYNEIASTSLPADPSGKTGIKQTLNWLDTTSEEYMLIMDNWPDEDLTAFLPKADRGNIIYTSRHQEMKQDLPLEAVAEVSEMEETEAVTFLLRTIRRGGTSMAESRYLRNLCLPIVRELGCLPLAIDQAGAYIDMSFCRLEDFLRIFREHKEQMLRDPQYQKATRQTRAVYTTFDLSFKVLQTYAKSKKGRIKAEAAQMAIMILSVICFYHNNGIMEEIIKRAAEYRLRKDMSEDCPLGKGKLCLEQLVYVNKEYGIWDPKPFRNGVILLESLSLVKRDGVGSLSVHVLVHSWGRDRMSTAERASFSLSARALIFDSLPTGRGVNAEDSLFRRRLLPHVFFCQGVVSERDANEALESLYDAKYAEACEEAGRWDEAERSWRRALYCAQMDQTRDSELCMPLMRRLSRFLYTHGNRWLEAGHLLLEIIERAKTIYGEHSSETIDAYRYLGTFFGQMGHMDTRVYCYEEIMRLCQANGSNEEMDRMEIFKEVVQGHHKKVQKLIESETEEDKRGNPEWVEAETGTSGLINSASDVRLSTMSNAELELWVAKEKDKYRKIYAQHRRTEVHMGKQNAGWETGEWNKYYEALDTYGAVSEQALNVLESLSEGLCKMGRMECATIVAKELVRRSIMLHGPPARLFGMTRLAQLVLYCTCNDRYVEARALVEHVLQLSIANLGRESHITQVLEKLCQSTRLSEGSCQRRDKRYQEGAEVARARGLTDAAFFLSYPPAFALKCCLDYPDRHSRWAHRLREETAADIPEDAANKTLGGLWDLGLDIPSSCVSPRYWGPSSEQLLQDEEFNKELISDQSLAD